LGKRDTGGVDMNDSIKLYPSNWLYNASVIGFLKVVDTNYNKVEDWFVDNMVLLPRDIFTKIETRDLYFNDDDERKVSKIRGNTQIYRNYINPTRKQDEFGFVDFVNKISQVNETDQQFCGICYRNFALSSEIIKELNEKWKEYCKYTKDEEKKKKSKKAKTENNEFEEFFSNLTRYNVAHNNLIAPSQDFINSFWNLNDSLTICPLCAYLIIHHHIPFESAKTQSGEIFINAPSFKVMWYLNKFAEQMLSKNKSYQIREILGMSFIEFAQKVAVTLGAWSMINIEMIIKKNKIIDYYSLPIEITRVLLQKEIASLISSTNEPIVLDTILSGKFSQLITLSHDVVRYLITKTKAGAVSQLKNKDTFSLKRLSEILPELYARINYITNREVIL
jgi:CRISPR-associated protein Cst1